MNKDHHETNSQKKQITNGPPTNMKIRQPSAVLNSPVIAIPRMHNPEDRVFIEKQQ